MKINKILHKHKWSEIKTERWDSNRNILWRYCTICDKIEAWITIPNPQKPEGEPIFEKFNNIKEIILFKSHK